MNNNHPELYHQWVTAVMAVLNAAWAAGEVDGNDYPVNRIGVIVSAGVFNWLADLYPERTGHQRTSYSTPGVNALLDKAEAAGRAYAEALAGDAA